MKFPNLAAAILTALPLCLSAQTEPLVHWETLGNTTGPDGKPSYTQRFTVVSDTPFSRLAFNQFARRMQTLNPADTLIEIVPGYYAVASSRFTAGDTVIVDIATAATLRSICYAPDGAHLVDMSGNPVAVKYTRADITERPEFYADGVDQMPYGRQIFAKNEKLGEVTLDYYDIVPSFKQVQLGGKIMNRPEEIEFVPTSDPRPDYFKAVIADGKVRVETNNATLALDRLNHAFGSRVGLMEAVIEDWPDFPYRGLMIDISRNYQTPEQLDRILTLMNRYGLNVLHFHVADDEAWRLEIPGLPELTSVGSRRGYPGGVEAGFLPQIFAGNGNPEAVEGTANGYFTRQDYINMLRRADELGIRVIPEIESPGHARAAIIAMERRLADTGDDTYRLIDPDDVSVYTSAQSFHDNVMNPAIPGPVRFMTKVGEEIKKMHDEAGVPLAAIHIGGDEVAKGAWTGSPIAKDYMERNGMTNERYLHLVYIRELLDNYDKMGIPVSGWQEIAVGHSDEYNARVRPSVYSVNCWSTLGGESSVPSRSAHSGYPTVLSNVDHFYLDMCYNYHPDERGLTWGGTVDEFDALHGYPARLCPVDSVAARNIIGISGQVFAEAIRSGAMLETYLLPKMLGLAERAWNADSTYTDAKFNTVIKMREIPEWQKRGYAYHLAQPGIDVRDGKVVMNTIYPGLRMHYTTDGTRPTAESPLYKEPFDYSGGEIRAIATDGSATSLVTILPEIKDGE
ncbi:MAG: family 20 glycosylhydrolase [Muribaculaceae bacterium]|nr:family 20 glycosylhydrolase [Muribaculaceae bacterium]